MCIGTVFFGRNLPVSPEPSSIVQEYVKRNCPSSTQWKDSSAIDRWPTGCIAADSANYLAFFAAAHRFFWAAAILARASALKTRFLPEGSDALFLGRPGPRLTTIGDPAPASIARACCNLLIWSSIAERIRSKFIHSAYSNGTLRCRKIHAGNQHLVPTH